MSILRYDATTGDWVIFAPERARRPMPPESPRAAAPLPGLCPFCPGHEDLAQPEIYTVREGGAWQVRVVANRFPILRIEEDNVRGDDGALFRNMHGCGAHEVIIESADHTRILMQQPVEQIERILRTLQVRFNDLLRDLRFQALVIFKNHGERAGTSLRHPHFQLIAMPVVPRLLRMKQAVATQYFDLMGRCLYCDILQDELTANERLITQNEQFVAFVPYAAGFPYEVWILPRQHQPSFGSMAAEQVRPLAEVLKTVLAKLYHCLDNPDFNLTVNTVPRGDEGKDFFLWHIRVVPRLTTPAGFELGSGMYVNTVLPETAAADLRAAEPV